MDKLRKTGLNEKRAAQEEQSIANLENIQQELGELNQETQYKTDIFDQRNADRTVDAMYGQQERYDTMDPNSSISLSETINLPVPRKKEDRILGASINEDYYKGGIKSKKSKKTKKSKKSKKSKKTKKSRKTRKTKKSKK